MLVGLQNRFQRVFAVVDGGDVQAHFGEHVAHDLTRFGQVVCHQRTQPLQICSQQTAMRFGCADCKRDLKPEAAALSGLAVNAHPATHHFNQALTDNQPQAGAAKLARGRGVGLLKRLEQAALLFGAQANAGICHFKAQLRPIVLHGQ